MKTLKTLYKKSTKGALQEWTIKYEDNAYWTEAGQVGGKITVSKKTICEGKNLGRANETSSEEQAQKEAQAKWDHKLKNGYVKSKSKVDEVQFFKPMLADRYEKRIDYVKEHFKKDTKICVQPKLDGIRCIVTKDGMFTRTGRPINSCPHIWDALKGHFTNPFFEDVVFDGELYNHDYKDNFNEITSLVKKEKLDEEGLKERKEKVQYHIYDFVYRSEAGFGERYGEDMPCLFEYTPDYEYITGVETIYVDDFDEIDEAHAEFIEKGYEGTMVRIDAPYENKRSKNLLKLKRTADGKVFEDAEFEIIDVIEGKGNLTGMASAVMIDCGDGVVAKAGTTGTEEYRTKMWKKRKKMIGLYGTVQFQNYTPDGKPRFPKLIKLRNEKGEEIEL
jgi:DNA ligase-1